MTPRALLGLAAALALAAPVLAADVQRQTPDAVSFVLTENAEKEYGAAAAAFLGSMAADPASNGWLKGADGAEPDALLDALARILRLPELRGWGCSRTAMALPDWPYVKGGAWEHGNRAHLVLDCGPENQLCFDLYFLTGGVEGVQYGVEIQRMDEARAAGYLRAARPIPANCVGS
ncbi:MAG: hypothetical protein ISN26_07870 [Betaproteobacteria bacterium AqS2]|uniref:Uncharacterized protein n=1 Tax=Candidatus Amphirhobacter heronislandensis TaxID=1732024 RepID=A0A930UHR5_9GAMM|nr:hypothetical protein [Betaproteobacteria bacterium AqS2]